MQRLLVYIRIRYQTNKLRRIQMCVISEDVLDLHSSIRPHVLTLLHCGPQWHRVKYGLDLFLDHFLDYFFGLFFWTIFWTIL